MNAFDSRGLAMTATNAYSRAGYEQCLDLLLRGDGNPLAVIDQVLAVDPAFIMGHALRAALLIMSGDERLQGQLQDTVEGLERLMHSANAREQRHALAARTWLQGDLALAIRRYGDIVIDYPRDSLALRVAHVGDFQLGQQTMLRDRVAQVLPDWDEGSPGFAQVLGMYAFGLAESAHYEKAEAVGRIALKRDSRNPGAVHAVAHVMEMQGRCHEGIRWLKRTMPVWEESTGYAVHLWWHLALFHLELNEVAAALDIYDRRVRAGRSEQAAALVDASALLWRLKLRGVDTGDRWPEVAGSWERKTISGLRLFNDVHAMLAYIADGRDASARRLHETLSTYAASRDRLRSVIRKAALPVCEALMAFGRGDYDGAVEHLVRLRDLPFLGGGSHAQYDLIHLILLEAALRSGRHRLAKALVAERASLRPASPSNRLLARRAETLIYDFDSSVEPIARELASAL